MVDVHGRHTQEIVLTKMRNLERLPRGGTHCLERWTSPARGQRRSFCRAGAGKLRPGQWMCVCLGGGGGWSVRIYCLGVVVASANLFIMHEPN